MVPMFKPPMPKQTTSAFGKIAPLAPFGGKIQQPKVAGYEVRVNQPGGLPRIHIDRGHTRVANPATHTAKLRYG